jgi:site-specific DNA recombinase
MSETKRKRCAIYCRVSSDERLDQSFNSIDAQREAGVSFVVSQKDEGWELAADFYEDPGFSGGNMERPGLQRLLKDIQAGKIDIVVVYKIDRLSRSLADFSKMVEVFDHYNVLLSFAQFEREVSGERIRDKIAASKRKGMWMGGPVPLGYIVKDRLLLIEPQEGELVQRIFEHFIDNKSTTQIVKDLNQQGIQTKKQKSFCKQGIYKILHNRAYIGEITHKGESFPAQHERLISQNLWDEAHAILASDKRLRNRKTWERKDKHDFLLRNIAYTEDGDLLIPTATKKPNGKVYRYYVINKKLHMGAETSQSWNFNADQLEAGVMEKLLEYLRSDHMVDNYWEQIQKINPSIDEPQAVMLLLRRTADLWNQFFPVMKIAIIQSLVKRVTVRHNGAEVLMRYEALGDFVKAITSKDSKLHIKVLEAA